MTRKGSREMAALSQFKVSWTGAGVTGLAYSTFYAGTGGAGVPGLSNGLVVFFNAIKALLPAAVTIQVPSNGQVYDDVTGQLLGIWGGPVQPAVAGTGAGALASASGASVKWLTGAIVRRHTLVGRTFLVPIVGSSFNTGGVITAANVNTIANAANTLAAVGAMRIWSRPTLLHPSGSSGVVGAATVTNTGAVLRSRRD
jgi:hypothetical protein